MHDKSVCQRGVYDRAVSALKTAKSKGFRVTINCTFFNDANPERVAAFFDTVTKLGVDGITMSPGYAYERAPDQKHFLNRSATKQLFRAIFRRGDGGRKWAFSQSTMFLDFLAGNQTYHCTPWGNPTRTVFGWQRPCYLLGEGYANTFKQLMEETDWDAYGVGNYEKCADCMVHSGFEATAVRDTVTRPWKALGVALRGVRTEEAMARTSRSIASDLPRTSSKATSPRSSQKCARPRKRLGRRPRQRSSVRNAAWLSRAAAISPLDWPGKRTSSPITAAILIRPSQSTGSRTRGGKSRSAGSATARRMAKGVRRSRAKRPAVRLSMSTAAAPVARCSSAFAPTVRRPERRRPPSARPPRALRRRSAAAQATIVTASLVRCAIGRDDFRARRRGRRGEAANRARRRRPN